MNADAGDGWLDGEPQAAEIDWAFESYARHLRGMAAQSSGERERMCRVLPEVVARWRDADPSFAALVQEANTAVGVCS